jgi:hypothetical protein
MTRTEDMQKERKSRVNKLRAYDEEQFLGGVYFDVRIASILLLYVQMTLSPSTFSPSGLVVLNGAFSW